MTNNLIIFCDSCSSISKNLAKELNVEVLPVCFTMEGVEYNPLDDNIFSFEEFYEKLENKIYSKTSCVNPDVIISAFKPFLEAGKDILYIPLSSGLSASANNALVARNILKETFENKIEIADPLTGSVGIYFAIKEAVKMRENGNTIEEIVSAIDKNKLNVSSFFTIGSLDHLRRGGRLSTISAILGSLLHINPIITVNDLGKLVEYGKYRGRKKAIKCLISLIFENAIPGSTICIGHTNCVPEALELKAIIEAEGFNVDMDYIDHTMGSHCGPKTIAIFYRNN